MSNKNKRFAKARAQPQKTRNIVFGDWKSDSDLECSGYTNLAHSPEVATAVDVISGLIGSMTIHLMKNTETGDIRVKDELSRILDINPNEYMSRSNFIRWIVKTMFLDGRGNAVVFPVTENGYLRKLIPIPAAYTAFTPRGMWDYDISINGREYNPKNVLHFALNPGSYYPWLGEGYQVQLSDVANNLKQAATTEKGFMSSKWKPSIIIKADALVDEFSSPEGRKKLLGEYIETSEAGEPWIIPAEQFSVEQVRPLTLSDLALADFVKLDKQTVATIIGVPPFVLGVGDFKRDAWNNFISTKIMPIAQILEQEFTKKLLYSHDMFFRFNSRSLYNYDIMDLAKVADDQFVRGIMSGNEVRDWIGMSPRDGLDELVILENYIPRGMIGDQNKLNGGD